MVNGLLSFVSGTLASLLANELGDEYHKKKNKHNISKTDQKIINKIDESIKAEFEKDKVKESIFKEQYKINKLGFLYDDDDKKQFVSDFFTTYKELEYLHDSSIEKTIYYCLDKINEIIDSILSEEGKALMSVIKSEGDKQVKRLSKDLQTNTETVIDKMETDTKIMFNKMDTDTATLVGKLDLIYNGMNQSTSSSDKIKGKLCTGYGKRRGLCNNSVIDNIGYCTECEKLLYFDRVIELYKIQGYDIDIEDGYFITTLESGIIKVRVMVFALFSREGTVKREDFIEVFEKINSINISKEYQFIHVVTNSQISLEHKLMLDNCNADIISEEKLISKIMDFSYYLQKAIDEYENSDISKHYIDVYDEGTNEPLSFTIEDFLSDTEENAFLILGDYGCGKTSFLLNLLYRLAKNYMYEDGDYIPLFIQLRDYNKAIDFDNLFNIFFNKQCNITNGNIHIFNFIQKCKKFVILFDGFDEVAKRVNYDVKFDIFNQICKYAVGDTKIILTSRPNYFQERNEYKKLIESTYLQFEPNNMNIAKFLETYISELNSEQINYYIESFREELKKENLDAQNIENIIENTHDLTDLSKRPFLLNIIIQTLPGLVKDVKLDNDMNMKINAANLYKRYTDLWLDRENLKGKTLIRKEDKLHFCKYLAFKMFKEEKLLIHFKEFPVEIKNYFSNLTNYEEIDYFSHDIQSCSFLNSDGYGYFKFIHKSFMEYFVACIISDNLKTSEMSIIQEAINIPNISSEIALFINDILEEDRENKELLIKIFEEMIDNVTPIIKENIITILSKTKSNIGRLIVDGKDYQNKDFSNASLSNVIIKDANFTRGIFYNASIENVIFENCIFDQVTFQKASLINVDFSGQSLIEVDMSYCTIINCNFVESFLVDVNMRRSDVTECNFDFCDMSGVDTSEARCYNNYNYNSAYGVPYDMG